jgi:tartrate dehydratase alpha subunit/fumarate hydratase class I-like protein
MIALLLLDLLKNANIAAGGILPMCQDTGTALIMGKKGQYVADHCQKMKSLFRKVFTMPLQNSICATRRWPQ